MGIISRLALKNIFRNGNRPVEKNFFDWFDSFIHKNDVIPIERIDGLGDRLNNTLTADDKLKLLEGIKTQEGVWEDLKNQAILKYNDEVGTMANDVIRLIDASTGRIVLYKETSYWHDGSQMNDSKVDDVVFVKKNEKYYKLQLQDIDVKMFGAISDGDDENFTGTNNKLAFEKAFKVCSQNRLRLIIDGKFKTSPLAMHYDNVDILMKSGTVIFGDSDFIWSERLWNISGKNINIEAYGAAVKMPNIFTSGEDRHLLNITRVEDLTIRGLKTIGGGGDGIYLGNIGVPPKRVKLIDLYCYNPRRNGISLINGIDIHIVNPICELANGTYPMAGIDIEPNGHTTEEELIGIRITNPITRNNNGYGILVTPPHLIGGSSYNPNWTAKQIDIVISGHLSEQDGCDGMRGGFGIVGIKNKDWPVKMSGYVKYQGVVKNPGGPGFTFSSWHHENSPLCDVDVYIENPASRITESSLNNYKAGVLINLESGLLYDMGKLNLNVVINDNRDTAVMYAPIYCYNTSGRKIIDININSSIKAKSKYGMANVPLVNTGNSFIGTINHKNYEISYGSTNTNEVRHWLGSTVKITSGISSTLPLSSGYIGQEITFKNISSTSTNVKLSSGDKFVNTNLSEIFIIPNQKMTFVCESDGWRVQGLTFATQNNSTATDVAALQTDFNSLLTKLKLAGLMN